MNPPKAACEPDALMYRQFITSTSAVHSVLETHAKAALESESRHLVLLHQTGTQTRAATSPDAPPTDASDRVLHWLGTDHEHVVWRTDKDWRLQELAAMLGTVRRGGVAVLLITADALQDSTLLHRLASMAYLRSIAGPSRISAYAVAVDLSRDSLLETLRRTRCDVAAGNSAHSVQPSTRHELAALDLTEQSLLLKRALQHIEDHCSEPSLLLVTGPRGTGKSSLLGRLNTALREQGHTTMVTGPHANSARHLLQHASGEAFIPIDKAVRARPCTVFIDEAASVPLAQLKRCVTNHHCCVLATTTDGYESSGRAFELLAIRAFADLNPHFHHLKTRQALRWQASDPIASLLRDAFFLPAESAPVAQTSPSAPHNIRYRVACGSALEIRQLTRAELTRDEATTRALVNLLNSTHYQSSLSAIDDMLSGRLDVHVALSHGELIGAVTTATERAVTIDLHDAIMANRRRIRDRLLPQLLARCANDARALGHDYQRVVRIAVDPKARRQGVGKRLVQHLLGQTDASVGAVFADDSGAAAFWSTLGFTRFHLGQKINSRSGQQSAAVLRSIDPIVGDCLRRAGRIYEDNRLPALTPLEGVCDEQLLQRLAKGERGLHETRAAVHRLWSACTGAPMKTIGIWPRLHETDKSLTPRQMERAIIDWVTAHLPDSPQ